MVWSFRTTLMIRFVSEIELNNDSLLSPVNATWDGGGYSAAHLPQITKETHAHSEPYCHTQPGSTGDQVDCFILQAIVSQTCCKISF